MQLYVGLDLHSTNTYIGIMDPNFRRIFKKRAANDLAVIFQTLSPFTDQLQGLVVESTYNWYWLVAGLMDDGYQCLHLANPSAIKQYAGLNYALDFLETAFRLTWLFYMLCTAVSVNDEAQKRCAQHPQNCRRVYQGFSQASNRRR